MPAQFRQILDTLSQLDSERQHVNIIGAAPNSVDWAVNDPAFTDWITQPDVSILHISGSAGSGVTTVASHLVKVALERRGYRDTIRLRFMFERHNIHTRSPISAVVALCHQLLLARPSIFRLVEPLCDFILEQQVFTRRLLWALLRSLLMHVTQSTTYCVLYAVHECQESLDDTIAGLRDLARLAPGSLKILLTSDEAYGSRSPNLAWYSRDGCRSVRRGGRHGARDLKTLVRANVQRVAQDKPLWSEFEHDIVRKLCTPSVSHFSAMHQMILLEWRTRSTRSTRVAMRKQLEEVSTVMLGPARPWRHDDHYHYNAHDREDWVRSSFRWVAFAVRPLTAEEMGVAVALDEVIPLVAQGIRLPDTDIVRKMLSERVSRDIVGDLLQVAPPVIRLVGNRVVPIHRELHEILYDDNENAGGGIGLSPGPGSHGDPHYAILRSCLQYLKLADGQSVDGAFLGYAAAYWPEHYRRCKRRSKPQAGADVRSFLDAQRHFERWAKLYHKREYALFNDPGLLCTSTQAICHLGFFEMLEPAALKSEVLQGYTDNLSLALEYAVRAARLEIAKLLLKIGVRSNRALGIAAACGQDDLVDVLIETDKASLKQTDEREYTALHHAACQGHKSTVELLLKHDTSLLNARTKSGSSAICLAAKAGQLGVVESLMRLNADLTLGDEDGYDALHLATRGGFSDIVDTILAEYHGPLRASLKDGNTAVHLAAQYDHPITLRRLMLSSSMDVELQNKQLYGPLHIASKEGFLSILRAIFAFKNQLQMHSQSGSTEGQDENKRPGTHSPERLILTTTDSPSPLHLAATEGHMEAVQLLLDHHAGCDKVDSSRALFVAASKGWDRVVSALLDHGASIDVEDEEGNTTVHQAVNGGNLDTLLKILGSARNKIDTPNHALVTPLHRAAEIGTFATVKVLLNHGASTDPLTKNKDTALHIAVRGGHRLVSRELQRNMNVIDQENEEGYTAFRLAVERGHIAIVKDLLLERMEPYFKFPFLIHAVLKDEAVLRSLLKSGEWDCKVITVTHIKTPLQEAVDLDLLPAVKLLLEHGADVDDKGKIEETPLYMAARYGRVNILDCLLSHGADVNATDKDGNTALFRASKEGFIEVVKRLLSNKPKPDVDKANRQGWSPLHVAATLRDPEISWLLLAAGANTKCQTNRSRITPMARAAFDDRNLEIVRHHLSFGADMNQEDVDGETAVHRAAVGGSAEVMKLFIEREANLNAKANNGCTPLHLAIVNSEVEVANLLLDCPEVDVSTRSNEHGSVLMSAVVAGLTSIVKRLLERNADTEIEADVDEPSTSKATTTMLRAAVQQGDLEMVRWLLDHDAQVSVQGQPHSSTVWIALNGDGQNRLEIVRRLLDADPVAMDDTDQNGHSVLRVAAAMELVDIVKLLVELRASTKHESEGKDPLMVSAAGWGHWPTLAALLEDPDLHLSVRDRFGRTPLLVAVYANRQTVVENLIGRSDVDINAEDHDGCTALMRAVLAGGSLVQLLLEKGTNTININSRDARGMTALIHACILNDKASVTRLLDAKSDTLTVDIRGRGPLYWACRMASTGVFEQVRRAMHRVSPDSFFSQRQTAICAAVASNKPTMLEMLLGPGDDITPPLPPEDAWTAMYTARRYGLTWAEQRLYDAGFGTVDEAHAVFPPLGWSPQDKTVNLSIDFDAGSVMALGK